MAAAAYLPGRRQTNRAATPEIYITKAIDNTRLRKVEDARRNREMKQFAFSLAFLFLLVMTYALQHFKSIEYGYKIEALRSERNELAESQRALQLEEATLKDPGRIDVLARKFGMEPPRAGQIVAIDAEGEAAGPVMASVDATSMVALQ